MSRADTCTLLSLDRYAKLMGINPVHFNGAVGEDIFPVKGGCSDVWWQRSYFGSDRVGREELAEEIAKAEEDIATYLGYWPAPRWESRELHPYPRYLRRDVYDHGYQPRGERKSIKLHWGKFISPGRRECSLVGHASIAGMTMVWSDPDGDGFDELMTITLPTSLTDASEQQIKVYLTVRSGNPCACEHEIRCPEMTVDITAGVLTITLPFWACIDPEQQDAYPTPDSPQALDITDATIYINACSVYRVYTDYSQHSTEFYWEPRDCCSYCGGYALTSSYCPECELHVQCGCLFPRDNELGIAVPTPGTWSASDAEWGSDAYERCEPPDQVKVWYYAGDLSNRFLSGDDLDPLSNWWAQTIAWLATSRLERNFCNCGSLTSVAQDLRMDMARSDSGGATWFLTDNFSENPFGTRKGEVMAWRRISKLAKRIPQVAVI